VSFVLGIYPNVVLDSLHLGLSSLLIGVNTPQELLLSFLPGVFLYKEMNSESKQSLDPNFITGFTDAEGCFMVIVSKRKDLLISWTVQAVFKITLHSKDLPLLKETFFGG